MQYQAVPAYDVLDAPPAHTDASDDEELLSN
jgi:hypothetical protein